MARRGKLVLEEYFFGFDRDRPHDLRSAGKTFASVMLGAAMRNGTKIAPETKVYDLLAGMGPFANPDPRKSQITLAHLMTHSAGFACDDNDDASPGNEDTMQTQSRQPDWWKHTLDLPMAHDPGRRYAYCSAWHLGAVRSGERTYRAYLASGNGGQLLIVIPELEMVVVFTGGNYRQGGIWLRWMDEIVGREIIPALRKGTRK